MSGWRHFALEVNEIEKVKFRLKYSDNIFNNNNIEIEIIDNFLCLCLNGYARDNYIDNLLIDELRKSNKRGYYLMMNNTTDTGNGLIRLKRSTFPFKLTDLVDEDLEQPRFYDDDIKLPLYQIDSPYWGTVYEMLEYYNFPIKDRYDEF